MPRSSDRWHDDGLGTLVRSGLGDARRAVPSSRVWEGIAAALEPAPQATGGAVASPRRDAPARATRARAILRERLGGLLPRPMPLFAWVALPSTTLAAVALWLGLTSAAVAPSWSMERPAALALPVYELDLEPATYGGGQVGPMTADGPIGADGPMAPAGPSWWAAAGAERPPADHGRLDPVGKPGSVAWRSAAVLSE